MSESRNTPPPDRHYAVVMQKYVGITIRYIWIAEWEDDSIYQHPLIIDPYNYDDVHIRDDISNMYDHKNWTLKEIKHVQA